MQGAERESMNIFEKIVKQLEDERLTNISAKEEAIIGMCGASANHYGGEICAYEKAIKIIDQVAEEMTCLSECSQCEVYDKEKHHCPRFCKVIKDSVKEIKENHYEEIRNKAIDEFVDVIKRKSEIEWVFDLEDEEQYQNFITEIDGIAEQLKSSGNSEQLNGWIPVEECLPEENQEVQLTFENSAGVHVGEATYKNNMFFYVTDTQFGYYEEVYKCPVAWKPKDKPYQKGA